MSSPCSTLYHAALQTLRAEPKKLWIPAWQLITFCLLIAACFPFLYHLLSLADQQRLTLGHTLTAYALVFIYFYLLQYHAALFDLWALQNRLTHLPQLTIARACLMALKSSLFVSTFGIAARYSKACAESHYLKTRLHTLPPVLHAQLLHLVWLARPHMSLKTALRATSRQLMVRQDTYVVGIDVGQPALMRWGLLILILALVLIAHLIPSTPASITLNVLAGILFITTRMIQLHCSQSIRIALSNFCQGTPPPPPFTTALIQAHIDLHTKQIRHVKK